MKHLFLKNTSYNDQEIQEARRYPIGRNAMELLDYLKDNKIISVGHKNPVFLTLDGGYIYEKGPFDFNKDFISVRDALRRRGYIAELSGAALLEELTKHPPLSKNGRISPIQRGIQWKRSYAITQDGLEAIKSLQTRLERKRKQEQDVLIKPRFVISYRYDKNNLALPGAGQLHTILRVEKDRVYLVPKPDVLEDLAVMCTSTNKPYLPKDRVLIVDATLDQYHRLLALTQNYDAQILKEDHRLYSLLEPLKEESSKIKQEIQTKFQESIVQNVELNASTDNDEFSIGFSDIEEDRFKP